MTRAGLMLQRVFLCLAATLVPASASGLVCGFVHVPFFCSRTTPTPEGTGCVGDGCCHGSSCMTLPGMSCSASRGSTDCIGSSVFPPQRGMCRCDVGVCAGSGTCVGTAGQGGLPGGSPYGGNPYGENPYGESPYASSDSQSGSHTGSYPKWYEASAGAAMVVPPEDLTVPLALCGLLGLSLMTGSVVLGARLWRRARTVAPEARDHLMEAVDEQEFGLCAE